MKLSTRARYAVRAMFDIAFHSCGQSVQVKDISRRQNVSQGYLEQIFQDLKGAELIVGQRGRNGGYVLAKDPAEIFITDILKATNANICFADCSQNALSEGLDGEQCGMYACCIAREMWDEVTDLIVEYFSSVSLKSLCDKAHAKGFSKDLSPVFTYII